MQTVENKRWYRKRVMEWLRKVNKLIDITGIHQEGKTATVYYREYGNKNKRYGVSRVELVKLNDGQWFCPNAFKKRLRRSYVYKDPSKLKKKKMM